RDKLVTGVQTCALPISQGPSSAAGTCASDTRHCPSAPVPGAIREKLPGLQQTVLPSHTAPADLCARPPAGWLQALLPTPAPICRSEERRVGKECRSQRG